MASGIYSAAPQTDIKVIPVSSEPLTVSSLGLIDSGHQNYESFGSSFDGDDALNVGFIDDQMLSDVVQENTLIDRNLEEKVVLPQSVEVDSRTTDEMEEEIQIIFEDVKRPCNSRKIKRTTDPGKERNKSTLATRKLVKENESLLKELENLKLEVAQQKSRNHRARHEHSNQVLDVLNTELTCAICTDIIIEAAAIECGHIFCYYCISTWFSQQTLAQSCPTCRAVTYRDPIKITKLSSTIASFHSLLSQEVQADRRQLLEDREAEQKKAQSASETRDQWFRNLTQAHERVSEAVRHLGGLSPDVHAFEGNSPGQGHTTYAVVQAQIDPSPTSSSTPHRGYNEDHPRIFLPSYIDRALLLHRSPYAAATRNPTRPTTLSQSANSHGQAAFVPPPGSVLSRNRQAREVTISEADEVMEISSAQLQQGPPSVSHQFHNRDPRLRPRPH